MSNLSVDSEGFASSQEGIHQQELKRKIAELNSDFLGQIMMGKGMNVQAADIDGPPIPFSTVATQENEGKIVVIQRQRGFLRYGLVEEGKVIELITSSYRPGASENQIHLWTSELDATIADSLSFLAIYPTSLNSSEFINYLRQQFLLHNLAKYTEANALKDPELAEATPRVQLDKIIQLETLSALATKYIQLLASGKLKKDSLATVDEATQQVLDALKHEYLAVIIDKELKILGYSVIKNALLASLNLLDLELQASHWAGGLQYDKYWQRIAFRLSPEVPSDTEKPPISTQIKLESGSNH